MASPRAALRMRCSRLRTRASVLDRRGIRAAAPTVSSTVVDSLRLSSMHTRPHPADKAGFGRGKWPSLDHSLMLSR